MAEKDDDDLDADLEPVEPDPPKDGDDQGQAEEQDDEPEGDDVDASQQQDDDRPDQRQQQQSSRGERRHQVLANEVRERDRQIAELKGRLDALVAAPRQQQQGETPEARAQRRALLTAEERITEDLQEARIQHQREMQALAFTITDGNDKAAYSAKATVDPFYKKWESQVEAELTTLRNQGMTAPREKIMYYLIGKAAVEGRQGSQVQRREGERRVARQQTRPSNSGSDVTAQRRQNSSLERRLENQAL